MAGDDPFAALGLPPTATAAEVKAAYREAARRLHPDAGGDEESFRALTRAAEKAQAYASGAEFNPYLPTEDHILYVDHYDRHEHSPAPPPRVFSRVLFWAVPVAGVIFMVSRASGRYFVPVFASSMAVLAIVMWVVARR